MASSFIFGEDMLRYLKMRNFSERIKELQDKLLKLEDCL